MKIFIIGLMGSGKSHTGKKLADKLGFEFIDLDQIIEKEVGKSITSIFEEQGEPAFRSIEQTHLLALKDHSNTIIATGGGTPCFFDNMQFMNENGLTVYLRTPATLLVERLSNGQSGRPLLKDKKPEELKQFFESQLKERIDFYEKAALIYFQEFEGQHIEDELIARLNLLKYSISKT